MLHVRTLILLAVAATMSLFALRRLRQHRLDERYVLLFLTTGIPVMVLAFWPDGIVWLEQTLMIEKPTLLVIGASVYFLIITFSLASRVSVQERQIHTLAQEIAILKAKYATDMQRRDADREAERLERSAHKHGHDDRSTNAG